MSAITAPLRRLRPGDPVPWFVGPTHGNPTFNFDTCAGRYVVLSFFGSARSPAGVAVTTLVDTYKSLFDDSEIAFFGVTNNAEDHATLLVERVPGIRWFLDADDRIARMMRAVDGPSESALVPQTLVLDPSLRVLGWIPVADPVAHARTLTRVLQQLPPISTDAWSPGVAPALIVPRIFERELCRRLIDYYETEGGTPSGHMSARDGRSVGVLDRARKRRKDCVITDQSLKQTMQRRIHDRLVPMIRRAFQFEASRIERYIVACYDGADRGFFFPHRDNTTPATQHRRFAVTINLNADEYEGGDLRFPEFGRATYRAPTGGAVVFSCSMLHEALPVTRGLRYATLPFLYDDKAAVVRDATRHLIDSVAQPEIDAAAAITAT
ncbi:MAG: 2OG-Fe(II) oxygenase [Alphaproteobacteria bacterium]